MQAINKAKEKLIQENLSFVLINGESIYTSAEKGIKPMYVAVTIQDELSKGALVADRVIGKAAALLAAYGGIASIHALLTTHTAIKVCNHYNIAITYDKVVEAIQNRDKTGLCPMEQLASETNDPERIVEDVKTFLTQIGQL
jgi:hypothetical protein